MAARPRAFVEIERRLRKQCAPLHRLRLGEIDRRKIAAMLAQIETASGPVARNRARSSLSAYFAWAITNGVKDAKISEDGLANALDVRAFKLTNGNFGDFSLAGPYAGDNGTRKVGSLSI